VASADLDGTPGGAVQFACTFQPAYGARFTWARRLLRLETPNHICIVDLAPREVLEEKPVQFTIDGKGKLGIRYQAVDASVEKGTQKQFAIYHCKVQGSGESTALARWDFNENPYRKDGLGPEQVLAVTLPVTGDVTGTVSVSAPGPRWTTGRHRRHPRSYSRTAGAPVSYLHHTQAGHWPPTNRPGN